MILKLNHKMLPNTNFQTRVHFLIENDNLLENYNAIWDKVGVNIKKEFDSEPVYNEELLKNKIKYHGDEVTDFMIKKFLRRALIILV